MAIASLDDISSDVFSFADKEILDANLAMMIIPQGLPHMAYNTQAARSRTHYLRFTITVSPCLIVPGVMDFDPAMFPNPTPNTVYVRALSLSICWTTHQNLPSYSIDKPILSSTSRSNTGPMLHQIKSKTSSGSGKSSLRLNSMPESTTFNNLMSAD